MAYTMVKHTNGMHIIVLDAKVMKAVKGRSRAICMVNEQLRYHAALFRTAGVVITSPREIAKQKASL